MRNILLSILTGFIILLAVMAIGSGRQLVDRHYDYLETVQDNTRLEQRIEALHSAQRPGDEATGSGALPVLASCTFAAISLILAVGAAMGQGGMVAFINNANKLARTVKRGRSGQPGLRRDPGRYVVTADPPITQPRRLPAPDDEIRWT